MAFTMAYPNLMKGLKMAFGPLGINTGNKLKSIGSHSKFSLTLENLKPKINKPYMSITKSFACTIYKLFSKHGIMYYKQNCYSNSM